MSVYECYLREIALNVGLRALLNNMWRGRKRGEVNTSGKEASKSKRRDFLLNSQRVSGQLNFKSKELFFRSPCMAVCVRDKCRLVCHVAFHI